MDNLAVANIVPAAKAASQVGQASLDAAGGSGAGPGAENVFGALLSKRIALLDPQLKDLKDLISADGVDTTAENGQGIDPSLLIQQLTAPIDPAMIAQKQAGSAQELVLDEKLVGKLVKADKKEDKDISAAVDVNTDATVIPVGNFPANLVHVDVVSGKDLPPELPAAAAVKGSASSAAEINAPAINSKDVAASEFSAALAAKLSADKNKSVSSDLAIQEQPQPQLQVQQNVATQAQHANAASASAGVPQQVGTPHWDTGLGDKVVWMLGTNTKVAELHLNPPALGPLEVRISMSDGQANLSFMTQHNSVGEAIESAKSRLREMMGESGVNMGSVSVNVGSFAQQQQQQQTQQQNSQSSDSRSVNDIKWLPEGESVQSITTTVQPLEDRGLVDLFA